ncbi:MAG: LLM class flavin-dependent oxidoreductase [Porticoccaceae bacterium]
MSIPLSILDLAYISSNSSPAEALRNSLDLAQHAETWGYSRYWLAEHHNMPGIASAATSVFIGYIAGGTKRIRVGAGGIMLPNHSPLVIAEQFGTLESLYPGRIDLGLGRAPGTDGLTLRALRRDYNSADTFPQDVMELQNYFAPEQPGQGVQAIPGTGLEVPLWILGSSLFGAQLAAHLGLPYAFASHFAPDALMQAIRTYREKFRPSAQLDKPYVMVAANVTIADTDGNARKLFTSTQQSFLNILRGKRTRLQPPVDDIESMWNPAEKAQVSRMLTCAMVGAPDTVARDLREFADATGADEIITVASIHDHRARLRSYELLSECWGLA